MGDSGYRYPLPLRFKVVTSRSRPDLVSLRTLDGGSIHELLTAAGFVAGDEVSLALRSRPLAALPPPGQLIKRPRKKRGSS